MSKSTEINRREFIITTSAAAIGTASVANGGQEGPSEMHPQAFRSASGLIIPYSRSELWQRGPQRSFTAAHLTQIAFPLGGIGTGTVALGGRGQLTDWEIFNRPSFTTRLNVIYGETRVRKLTLKHAGGKGSITAATVRSATGPDG